MQYGILKNGFLKGLSFRFVTLEGGPKACAWCGASSSLVGSHVKEVYMQVPRYRYKLDL